jgi:hypothetical protein
MNKYQIKGDWIISENPFHSSDCMSISMKLSEVCIIKTEKRNFGDYFYCIHLFTSNSQVFVICYMENELEQLNIDLKEIEENIFKFNKIS